MSAMNNSVATPRFDAAQISLVLVFSCVALSALADTGWYFDADSQIATGTGIPADFSRAVAWRDTQLNPTHPDQILGKSEEIAVQQLRTIPPVQAFALFAFDGLFGSDAGQVPTGATIRRATVWLDVVSAFGSQSIGIRGLNPLDGAWVESEATFNQKAGGASWTGGSFAQSLVGNYGSFENPQSPGWFGVDVTAALIAYQAGQIGGIAFVSSSSPVADIRNFYCASNEGLATTAPGLWVDFIPVPEPQTWMLLALGVAVLGRTVRRMRKAELDYSGRFQGTNTSIKQRHTNEEKP